MNKINSVSSIELDVTIKLNESEARALLTITSYGHQPFIDWFYKNLGKSYLKPHETGLVSLFETIKRELPKHLNKADDARKLLKGAEAS